VGSGLFPDLDLGIAVLGAFLPLTTELQASSRVSTEINFVSIFIRILIKINFNFQLNMYLVKIIKSNRNLNFDFDSRNQNSISHQNSNVDLVQ
jgi:hypothetical protein